MKPSDFHFHHTILLFFCLTGLLFLPVSCLKDRPETFPEDLVWNPELAFPLGSHSFRMNAESGFDTTLLDLDTITGIPEWVDTTVTLKTSFEFDLASLGETRDELNRALFRVNVLNGFPNDILVQGYFLDQADNFVDSLFLAGPLPVAAGQVVGNGETIDPNRVRQDAVYEGDRARDLEDAAEFLFSTTISSSDVDTSLIRYYPYYQIDVVIGAMLDFSIEY
jgi:hypothetical protein